ncbi:hypothetical protein CRG98_008814 [Punica granatum]|uniref:Uncharacterized protein n=1 Tax=Punica granatum TaxID=22663 RepID=A0A2I0KQL8_PUNGR|nr:hypothetical protein CRG98_008814 [Punica granatum]
MSISYMPKNGRIFLLRNQRADFLILSELSPQGFVCFSSFRRIRQKIFGEETNSRVLSSLLLRPPSSFSPILLSHQPSEAQREREKDGNTGERNLQRRVLDPPTSRVTTTSRNSVIASSSSSSSSVFAFELCSAVIRVLRIIVMLEL